MAYELQAETRTTFGKKVKALRRTGKIPAEIYGREADNISVQIDAKNLRRVLSEAGATHLISITVDKEAEPVMALARNIQYSPVKRDVLHVDFYKVIMTETVSVSIPIIIIGESPLSVEGGTLMTGINILDIEALPANLPESVEVDVSGLINYADSILVSDLNLPSGVTIHSSLDSLVATVQPPRLSAEEETSAEITEMELDKDDGDEE